jgi:hypothetical protein
MLLYSAQGDDRWQAQEEDRWEYLQSLPGLVKDFVEVSEEIPR